MNKTHYMLKKYSRAVTIYLAINSLAVLIIGLWFGADFVAWQMGAELTHSSRNFAALSVMVIAVWGYLYGMLFMNPIFKGVNERLRRR
jgi:hypothetical protein